MSLNPVAPNNDLQILHTFALIQKKKSGEFVKNL